MNLEFEENICEGFVDNRPGIYSWMVEGAGKYYGKFTHIRRPCAEYRLNVRRYLAGESYRKGKPEGFRHIHRVLARAMLDRRAVTLTILENVAPENLTKRESEWIARDGNLNRTGRGEHAPDPKVAEMEQWRAAWKAEGSTRPFAEWVDKWIFAPPPGMNDDGTVNIVGYRDKNGKFVFTAPEQKLVLRDDGMIQRVPVTDPRPKWKPEGDD